MKIYFAPLALIAVLLNLIGNASAQTTTQNFGVGGNSFSIDFQTISDAGNAADSSTGYGSVGYNYSIGTYDISQNQLDSATANGLLGVAGGAWSGDQPAANVSWFQAAAFVNWLNTSKGHQAAYNLTYSGGTYTMALWQSGQAGYDPSNPYRNSLALFVLPTENEFYKAAWYNPSTGGYNLYTTGSPTPTAVASGTNPNTAVFAGIGTAPSSVYKAGGLSAYGTMGQGGNIWQWEETAFSGSNTDPNADRGARGGRWTDPSYFLQSSLRVGVSSPSAAIPNIGFRVAEITANAVPEPTIYGLIALGSLFLIVAYRRQVA